MHTYTVITLGCKVNQAESAGFGAALRRVGLRPAPPGQPADLCLVHTCAVTAQAVAKSRRAVAAAARGPAGSVVVTGCWADADAARAAELDGVDLVLSTAASDDEQAVRRLADWIDRRRQCDCAGRDLGRDDGWMNAVESARSATASAPQPRPTAISANPLRPSSENSPPPARTARTRALVKVQDGCDAFCTFCIVPFLRRRPRSRPVESVVEQVRGLVAAGVREVVLVGVALTAFGQPSALRRRWTRPPGGPLVELLDRVSCVEGLARIRLSSLDPAGLTDELIALMADRENIVPHLHLSLQSGSDRILRRMNRQYDAAAFRRAVELARGRLDRPALTSDVIVGFPGETEADFADTLALCRFAGFVRIHAFRYSPRPGTAAARRADDVAPAVARERLDAVVELAADLSADYRRQFVGRAVRVLAERPAEPPAERVPHLAPTLAEGERRTRCAGERPDTPCPPGQGVPPGRMSSGVERPVFARGRADRYFMVHFPCERPGELVGRLVNVRVARIEAGRTVGVLERSNEQRGE